MHRDPIPHDRRTPPPRVSEREHYAERSRERYQEALDKAQAALLEAWGALEDVHAEARTMALGAKVEAAQVKLDEMEQAVKALDGQWETGDE